MTKAASKTANKRTVKAENVAVRPEMEWNYAQFHFRHATKPTFVEAVLIDGEAWYLVRDVAQLIADLVSDTFTHDVEEMIETKNVRMFAHDGTGEIRRFIQHDELAHLLLTSSISFVA